MSLPHRKEAATATSELKLGQEIKNKKMLRVEERFSFPAAMERRQERFSSPTSSFETH